jgi:hypothetical protein
LPLFHTPYLSQGFTTARLLSTPLISTWSWNCSATRSPRPSVLQNGPESLEGRSLFLRQPLCFCNYFFK